MNRKEAVARKLIELGALQLRPNDPFTWASGIKSPIYCDNRIIMSFPKVRKEIANYFREIISEKYPKADVIAGCATAGIPHAAWVADLLNLPMIYVRGEAKSHGKQNQIEGLLAKGLRVIVIEDLISTGKSSLNTAKAIQDVGAEVEAVLSIFTYGLDVSKNNFKTSQISHESLTDFDALVEYMFEEDHFTYEEKTDLLKWRNNLFKS